MPELGNAVLLLSCPDQPGLVAAVSDFVYRHDGNILHADQHADREEGVFLQRVEWELEGFGIDRDGIAEAFRPVADKFGMRWSVNYTDRRPRVAVLASRLPHCLYDLLVRQRIGDLNGDIELVISNHEDCRGVASSFGVEFHCLPVDDANRDEQESAIQELLAANEIDLVVLARYMQVLSPRLVAAHPGRIINIHHSFLPAFAGARPYHQAFERGVKIIGATAHYVTDELDQGPIIEQDVVRVSHRDSIDDLVRKGRDLEQFVLGRAVGLHLRHRIVVYGRKTVVFD